MDATFRQHLRRAWMLAGLLLLPMAVSAQSSSLSEQLEGKSPRDRLVFLKQMLEEGNGSKEVYFYLGNAYYETGDINGAVVSFANAIELDPQYFKAIVNLALMYVKGLGVPQDYAAAFKWMDKAAKNGEVRAKTAREEMLQQLPPEIIKKSSGK